MSLGLEPLADFIASIVTLAQALMFIWMLGITTLVAFMALSWATLGSRLRARRFWLLLAWMAGALLLWRLAAEQLQGQLPLAELAAFVLYLAVLAGGYYQLQRGVSTGHRSGGRSGKRRKRPRPRRKAHH